MSWLEQDYNTVLNSWKRLRPLMNMATILYSAGLIKSMNQNPLNWFITVRFLLNHPVDYKHSPTAPFDSTPPALWHGVSQGDEKQTFRGFLWFWFLCFTWNKQTRISPHTHYQQVQDGLFNAWFTSKRSKSLLENLM